MDMMKKAFFPVLCGALLAAVMLLGLLPPAQFAHADVARTGIYSKTVDVGSLVDAAGETETITVPGAQLGDACVASFAVDVADMTVTCYVQAAGAVEVRVQNESTATVNLASTTMRVFMFPHGTR